MKANKLDNSLSFKLGNQMKQEITTNNAPAPIGAYSQAIKSGNTVYISGQIPLDPSTMQMVEGDFTAKVTRVFESIKAIAQAAEGNLNNIVKLNVYLLDMVDFPVVGEVMESYFEKPYPARAGIAVKQLPKDAVVEIEAVMVI